ncbi:MAG: septum formation initiator family protein [Bacteroidales bacterium]|nr:septum formation initiator family protein [Bacteroidales bacterium]
MIWSKLFRLLKTKWGIASLFFVVWFLFMAKNNYLEHRRMRQRVNELEAEKGYLQGEISKDSLMLENLKDKKALERYGRENYLMKKADEDIYLIERVEEE